MKVHQATFKLAPSGGNSNANVVTLAAKESLRFI